MSPGEQVLKSSAPVRARRPLWAELLLRAPLMVIGVAAVWAIRDVAYPAGAIEVKVHGREARISVGVPDPVSMGRELPGLPRFLPCSVRVNVDTRFTDQYGVDGLLTWTAAHEMGHCMEKLLPGGRSTLRTPQKEWLDGWDARTAASETYADAWASLYIARCGVDLAPLGWPDQLSSLDLEPVTPVQKAARLREAQRCLPRPEEAVKVASPVITLLEVRRLGGLDLSGKPQSTLSAHKAKTSATWRAYLARLSEESGVDAQNPPPASFAEAGTRAEAWLRAQQGAGLTGVRP